MKSVFILAFISIFLSCKTEEKKWVPKFEKVKDSALFYYNISTDTELSVNQRLDAINKSFLFVKEIDQDTLFSKVLYQKNLIYFSLAQYDSLKRLNDVLVHHAIQAEDWLILGRQYYLMARYFDDVLHLPDSAFHYYTFSKSYYNQYGERSWVGINLLCMGLIQQNQNDYFGSKETITEALTYLDPSRDYRSIASCYNALATNHRKLLNYSDAIKYYKKAIKVAHGKTDTLIYQNNMAATYIDSGEYSKAITILRSVAQDSILRQNQKEYARVLDNLAYAQWLFGEEIAAKAFLIPLYLRKQKNDKRGLIASYTHLGEFYSKKKSKKAISYFDSVIKLSKKLKIPRAEKDAIKHLVAIQPQSLKLRDRYIYLQDSLYAQELKVKTQFAKFKYDDKLKQEAILRLQKENAEKELELAQQRNQKIVSYSGWGLLFMTFGFATFFFIQRTRRLEQKNRTAKLEATFETEEALSRRLHDDFGGKLNHTMLLLQNNTATSKVLDVVEELYNQSRDFAREINDVDTGPNFKNLLFGMLSAYSKDIKLIATGSTTIHWDNISAITKKTLYRVLHELMKNMQKHSKATLVSIDFKQSKKLLKIEYSDDGVGASEESLYYRNGLWNTEKRIEAIDGTITFDTEKENGFRVQIEVPT
ncbi:tetratricopeptide repeat protein [Ascidiimonas aurantiaca]|uniref:tetratricopeptide repeat protein n=1 Tax=Ascidiimonas aurantiaca TaxID=1685432 RepID=UPI0030ED0815